MPSEISAISPLADRLMRLVEDFHCAAGKEPSIELGKLSKTPSFTATDWTHKLVHGRFRCQLGKGISLIVKDQGQGFDANAVRDPSVAENVEAEYGRGIFLMKQAMDEVSFKGNGPEVHMRKLSGDQQEGITGTSASSPKASNVFREASNSRR
jgi:hypothetical protein